MTCISLHRVRRLVPALLLAAATLAAQPAPRLSLSALVREALERNPEIAAAQKRYEAARQRPSQLSALPDPMISPGFNSSGRPWPGAGLGAEPIANIGVMVSQEIPYPGKRKLAGDAAAREAEAEWETYQQVQWNVVSRLKQAYYRLAFLHAAADVLDRNASVLEKLLRITEARYSTGKAEQQDILRSQTQLSILETRRVALDREKRVREAELNSLLNRPPNTPLGRPADLLPIPLPASLDDLRAARADSPMIRREEKMLQRAEIGVNQARKEFFPDVTLNAGYYNMGRMPDMYMFRADLKVPLYYFRKQRPGVTEQANRLAQARKTLEATARSLDYRIEEDYAMAEASARLATLYRGTVIPQAGLTLASALASYEAGRTDFLNVLTNHVSVLEYEMNYYEELQNFYLALARLEEMTGRRLLP